MKVIDIIESLKDYDPQSEVYFDLGVYNNLASYQLVKFDIVNDNGSCKVVMIDSSVEEIS